MSSEALGKLGHAEILLEGKGSAACSTANASSSPHRLKLPAGPYVLDIGEGEFEVTLKRGEKRSCTSRNDAAREMTALGTALE